MTTIETTHDALGSAASPVPAVASWVTTVDHKRIGRLFIVTASLALVGALVIGVLLGLERLDTDSLSVLDSGAVLQLSTAFRLLLALGAVAPLMIGLAVAIVPMQVGSRSIAFPRLAASGLWTWLAGLSLAVAALIGNGGPSGGEARMVDLFILGLLLVALGLTMAAGSVALTVLTSRAPGMTMRRVPLFTWGAFVTSIGWLLTMPVAAGTAIYSYVDHRYGGAAFGAQGSLAEMGWALTQPHTYVLALLALGVAAEIIPVAARSRHPMRPGVMVGLGVFAVTALAAVTQTVPHLPWDPNSFSDDWRNKVDDLLPFAFFVLLPLLGVVMILGSGALALKNGKPRISAAFVASLLGSLLIAGGVAAHVVYAVDDAGLQGTTYEEGVFLLVALGAALSALGAVAFWGPKLWGRRLSEVATVPLALLGALGAALAAVPLLIAGFADQPAAVVGGFDYSGPQTLWNALATIGLALFGLVVLAFAALAARSFVKGPHAGDDPHGGHSLEWTTSSPPPENNFAELPVVMSAEPVLDSQPAGSDS